MAIQSKDRALIDPIGHSQRRNILCSQEQDTEEEGVADVTQTELAVYRRSKHVYAIAMGHGV